MNIFSQHIPDLPAHIFTAAYKELLKNSSIFSARSPHRSAGTNIPSLLDDIFMKIADICCKNGNPEPVGKEQHSALINGPIWQHDAICRYAICFYLSRRYRSKIKNGSFRIPEDGRLSDQFFPVCIPAFRRTGHQQKSGRIFDAN